MTEIEVKALAAEALARPPRLTFDSMGNPYRAVVVEVGSLTVKVDALMATPWIVEEEIKLALEAQG